MKINVPSISEAAPRPSDYNVTLSGESLALLAIVLDAVVTDAYEAGPDPHRVHHLARDWHRVRQTLNLGTPVPQPGY